MSALKRADRCDFKGCIDHHRDPCCVTPPLRACCFGRHLVQETYVLVSTGHESAVRDLANGLGQGDSPEHRSKVETEGTCLDQRC